SRLLSNRCNSSIRAAFTIWTNLMRSAFSGKPSPHFTLPVDPNNAPIVQAGDLMKVIHATSYFLPQVVGGIETYIYHLARIHRERNIESVVALPDYGELKQTYVHDGQVVTYFPASRPSSRASKRRIYAEFKDWLRRQQADVYHQHSFIPPMSDWQLAAAKSLNLQTVVTIQEPSVLCLRDTFMAFGTNECDGEINNQACTRCLLHGTRPLIAQLGTAMPLPISSLINSMPKVGRFRALGTKRRVAELRALFSSVSNSADCMVAVSHWLHWAIQHNGSDPKKIAYVPNAAAHCNESIQ